MKLLGFCFGPESFWNLYFTFEADDESFQRAWDVFEAFKVWVGVG